MITGIPQFQKKPFRYQEGSLEKQEEDLDGEVQMDDGSSRSSCSVKRASGLSALMPET